MRALIAIFVIACCSACTDSPAAPTRTTTPPVVVPACQTNRTGTISVVNLGSKTVDVLWSGAVIGTLAPRGITTERTVVAGGAQYVLDYVITNTFVHPCLTLTATPLQCTNNVYSSCSGF